jgi:hypothetical protein
MASQKPRNSTNGAAGARVRTERDLLTVAAVVKGRDGGLRVRFNERARPYALGDDAELLSMLQLSARKAVPVEATLDLRRGIVTRAAAVSGRRLEAFREAHPLLDMPVPPVPIEVPKIDPFTFNWVDIRKWPPFKLCTRTIPNYATAKAIFDYCAAQSCHLPGPVGTPPCIPFQYVIDGCYARAHQMRRIITKKYRYCVEKVFSFALGPDDLSVKADKWGGCCVNWWYHVAPLVRVQMTIPRGILHRSGVLKLSLAMVIDPGMFDKPVLLSTWLAAQENTACNPNAKVTKYSIQPGSAYWPANGTGTAFGTDPTYQLTEQTLLNYAPLTTCP